MKTEKLLLLVFVAATAVFTATSFYGSMIDTYSSFGATRKDSNMSDFSNTATRAASTTQEAIGNKESGLRNAIEGIPVIGNIFNGLSLIANVLKTLFNSIDIIDSLMKSLFYENPFFQIPNTVTNYLFAAIATIALFSLLRFVTNRGG